MTILQSLAGYYDRMARRGDAEPLGFTRKSIDFMVVIDADGGLVRVESLRRKEGRKLVGKSVDVPAEVKRTAAVLPNFLWDKTAYALGLTKGEGRRTAQEYAAFRDLHLATFGGSNDPGLAAMCRFLERWTPERATQGDFDPDLADANVVFHLVHDEIGNVPQFIHQRDAALPFIEARAVGGETAICLVTGTEQPVARLHPPIRGVDGAQSAGAALVSFNLDAFESYGRKQGGNAPTGQVAAFKYGAALNRLLDRNSDSRFQLIANAHIDPERPAAIRYRQRARLGDATILFWADATEYDRAQAADQGDDAEAQAAAAELLIAQGLGASDASREADDDTDDAHGGEVRQALTSLLAGKPVRLGNVYVPKGVCLNFLGLSPNVARLSVRFWLTGTLGFFADRIAEHAEECRIEPSPHRWGQGPSINRLLLKTTAAQEKWENIPPLLAGEVARAVLSGGRYPRTLLSTVLMRLRAGANPGDGWHAAAIRAVLARDARVDARPNPPSETEYPPVSLKPDHPNPGYQLGRLFASYEAAQRAALGAKVNATIRDKYFGAATATPGTIFPIVMTNGVHHLSKVRKEKPGLAVKLEKDIGEILERLDLAGKDVIPRTLPLLDQGAFVVGYYHQRQSHFRKAIDTPDTPDADLDTDAEQGE